MVYRDHAFQEPLCHPWFYRFAIYTNYVYTSLHITNPDLQITEYLPIYFPPIWYYRFNDPQPPRVTPVRLPSDVQLYILRFLCDTLIFWPHFYRQYINTVHPDEAKRECTDYYNGDTVYQDTDLLATNRFVAGHLILDTISPFYDEIQQPPFNTVEWYVWRKLPHRLRVGSIQNPTSGKLSQFIHDLGPFDCVFYTRQEERDTYAVDPKLFTKPTLYFWRDNQPLPLSPVLQRRYAAPSYIHALFGSREYIKHPTYRHLHPNSQLYYCAPSHVDMIHKAWNDFPCIFPYDQPFQYPPNLTPQTPHDVPPRQLVPLSAHFAPAADIPLPLITTPRTIHHTCKDQFPFTHAPIELPHLTREQSSFANYTHFRVAPTLESLQDEWQLLRSPSEAVLTQRLDYIRFAQQGRRPPPTFNTQTPFTYHTTGDPQPRTSFGIYESPQNQIFGIAMDTLPAFFFFEENQPLQHILPKITYQITENAALPHPAFFIPFYPEPEIVDAFIVNRSRFVEQLHPRIAFLSFHLPHIDFVRLCRFWFAWNPQRTPAILKLIADIQPFLVNEMAMDLLVPPPFEDYESSVQLYWRIVQPPERPSESFKRADAVFRHFIATAAKRPVTPVPNDTFWTVQPSVTYPYAWDESLTLQGLKPKQNAQDLCTIPQDRFYDLDQSGLPYLPGTWKFNQRPTSQNTFLPILVHTWIPHSQYPQLEAPNNPFNRCSQGVRQAIALTLLEDSIWEDIQIQQPQLMASLESVFHKTMTSTFHNLLVDPIALCDSLSIRREDVCYRWQDNAIPHTFDPMGFSLDCNNRYQYFVRKFENRSLMEAYKKRAPRFSDWPRLRVESRLNQNLPDWENPLFPLP